MIEFVSEDQLPILFENRRCLYLYVLWFLENELYEVPASFQKIATVFWVTTINLRSAGFKLYSWIAASYSQELIVQALWHLLFQIFQNFPQNRIVKAFDSTLQIPEDIVPFKLFECYTVGKTEFPKNLEIESAFIKLMKSPGWLKNMIYSKKMVLKLGFYLKEMYKSYSNFFI